MSRSSEARRLIAPEAPALRLLRPDAGPPRPAVWKAWFRALRPHQWSKNVLVFLPLVLAHQVDQGLKWLNLALAFAVFSACASAVYLINDLLDVEADRHHPTKQFRPLAAGWIRPWQAAVVAVLMMAGALAASAVLLPTAFTAALGLYLLMTSAYSFYFKRTLFLDVVILAGLYTLRLLAGGFAAEVEVSEWLRAFSMFLFISLALVKRYVELRTAQPAVEGRANRRGYLVEDAELIPIIGLVSGYVSVLVFCLYLNSTKVALLYPHCSILWLIAPALLYWLTRLWLLARRNVLADDPVVAAFTDPNSYAVGLVCAVVALAASF